jgi:SAM-dependent methyltransferase
MSDPPTDELEAIRSRYARRGTLPPGLYDPLNQYVRLAAQQRERALVHCLWRSGLAPLANKRALEVGCGSGDNLLDLMRLGFRPENLVGNELLEDRLATARERLPVGVTLVPGDAATLDLPDESFDCVLQSTVFTSILDDALQERLARRMWALVRPGGGVLWYDFVWNNPRNQDVRGVPVARVRRLFPEGMLRQWRVTLAPPLGRLLCQVSPALYGLANVLPLLRTHVLCWIAKPRRGPGIPIC